MKIAKFLLNFLLFCLTFVIILGAQYGITALFSAQAGDDAERVHIEVSDETVSYLDVPVFLVEDLKVGYENEDYVIVRNWVNKNWWRENTEWVDTALSKVVVTFKAIFMPIGDIKDIKEKHIEGWTDEWANYENFATVLKTDEYKRYIGVDPALSDDEIKVIAGDRTHPDYEIYTRYQDSIYYCDASINEAPLTEGEWKNEYSEAYRFIRIARHYNNDAMQTYYNKFIDEDGKIKFAAVSVYSHILIAFVVSCWFLHNNSFKINRDEDHNNVVEGGYKGLPGFRKNTRKKGRA